MNALREQLIALPARNLALYLLGLGAMVCSFFWYKGIEPQYQLLRENLISHERVQRLAGRFELDALQAEIAQLRQRERALETALIDAVPERVLAESLPTLLESLHQHARGNQLKVTAMHPGAIDDSGPFRAVSVSVRLLGRYRHLHRWLHSVGDQLSGLSFTSMRAEAAPATDGQRTLNIELLIYGQ